MIRMIFIPRDFLRLKSTMKIIKVEDNNNKQ